MQGEQLRRLAELAVVVGANVRPGQVVAVAAHPDHRPLVHAVAEASYRHGARFVDVTYFDADVKRLRLLHAGPETLDYVPPWYGDRILALGENRCARIALTPLVPPGLLADVDPALAGRDGLPFVKETFSVINDRTTNWTVIPYPNAAWARAVHPDLEPGAALARLTEEILHVCRLDEDDPVAAWSGRMDELERVAERLTEQRFDAVRFTGPGTDLTVGLFPHSLWSAARTTTVEGIEHLANVPSEEVTTTPDPTRADGVVAATKPLDVFGAVVRGLRIRFEGGHAVEIEADENAEVLRGRCASDEGAARLGEVALVDRRGRIGPLGTVFQNTLLDENAASHLALGSAYAVLVGEEDVERINRSAIHIDFMIGSDEVDVTGLASSGEAMPILRGGDWQV